MMEDHKPMSDRLTQALEAAERESIIPASSPLAEQKIIRAAREDMGYWNDLPREEKLKMMGLREVDGKLEYIERQGLMMNPKMWGKECLTPEDVEFDQRMRRAADAGG